VGSEWFTFSMAYGDNGTVQTVEWDGQVHARHVNYGADKVVTTSPTPLPGSVALLHTNDWSANTNVFFAIMQAEHITFTDIWETPQVGSPPQPIAYYLPVGWNCPEDGGEPLADFSLPPEVQLPGQPVQFADLSTGRTGSGSSAMARRAASRIPRTPTHRAAPTR